MCSTIRTSLIKDIMCIAKEQSLFNNIESVSNFYFESRNNKMVGALVLKGGDEITIQCFYPSRCSINDNLTIFAEEASEVADGYMAKKRVSEAFAKLRSNMVTVNDDVYYIQYNKEIDTIEIGTCCNSGLMVDYSYKYDHFFSIDHNLQEAIESFEDHLRELSMI